MSRFLEKLKSCINKGCYEWRKHALVRMAERGILQSEVLEALLTGRIIETYTEDRPYPSYLLLGFVDNKPLHVVCAFNEGGEMVYIITVYRPTSEMFGHEYDDRRKT